jgi:xylulokinase
MSLLGIDIGTSGCKAAAFAVDGTCLGVARRTYAIREPQPGWAELDSREVWGRVCECISEAAAKTRHDPVTALGTSSFGEAVVPVSRQREILGTSILCMDPRGAEQAAALEQAFGLAPFFRINGNLPGPQYSLPKLLWLRAHDPALYARADHWLLWSDLVAFLLGSDPVASNSLASRTLLLDVQRNDWSPALLDWSGIRPEQLGRVVPGGTPIGIVAPRMAAALGLPPGVRVVAGGHDQCCNALGSGCIEAGKVVCGIGTFECLTPCYAGIPDPARMLAEGLNVEPHVLPGLYVSFLFNQAGALVNWCRLAFGAERAHDPGLLDALNAEMPDAPTRLLVLPHFTPPLWPRSIPDSAGGILGLRTGTTRGEIFKAVLEGATYYFVDGIESLRRMGIDTTEFIATGGGAQSDRWLQIKADIFGVPFVRPRCAEGSLAGAAMLAGLGTGALRTPREAVSAFVAHDRTFRPDAARHACYVERMALFRRFFPAVREIQQGLCRTP